MMKLHLISLGCARNTVDSEIMQGQLAAAGWSVTEEIAEANVIIVNTCSFIESAINESVDTILELAKFKENGACQKLIVTGCLPERFREDIAGALPEVDVFLGTGAFDQIVQAAALSDEAGVNTGACILPDPNCSQMESQNREPETAHMAYLKIAEGCGRRCTYCIIPKLRGNQRSRSPEAIVSEARGLVESGVKELVLIAQDTTNYGADLSQSIGLGGLLARISDISDDIWIRFLYGHPESLDESVIRTVSERGNICAYFDVPIQHASSSVLKRMGRHYSTEMLLRQYEHIRTILPDAALRTTVIVGFPGETDADFEILSDFVKEVRFDHLGVFTYSDSEDLPSHRLSDHVPKHVAQDRHDQLMSAQLEISAENNQKYLDQSLTVLLEEHSEEKLWIGRTRFQAPEVDGITYVHSEKRLRIGSFADVRITDTLEYDLVGEVEVNSGGVKK